MNRWNRRRVFGLHCLLGLLAGAAAGSSPGFDTSRLLAPPPPVYFSVGSAGLDAEAKERLRVFARTAQSKARVRLNIAGHADRRGTAAANERLSLARANAVRAHLQALGVADQQMTVFGYGEDRPACPEDTEGCRKRSRRVEVQTWLAGRAVFDAVPANAILRVVVRTPGEEIGNIPVRIAAFDPLGNPLADIMVKPGDPRLLQIPGGLDLGDLAVLLGIQNQAGTVRIELEPPPETQYWPVLGILDRGTGRLMRIVLPA